MQTQSKTKSLKIFFHICAINHAWDVVKEQMTALIYSGLYDDPRLKSIYCFITARDLHSLMLIRSYLQTHFSHKIVIVKEAIHDTTFERFTLERMRDWIDDEDAVLYFHSKGVTHTEPDKVSYCQLWTNAMNYFLIGRFRECLNALDAPCDVIGAFYSDTPVPHFQGNFWWARGAYLKTLPVQIGPEYLAPELNYLFTQNPRYVAMGSLPESIRDLYKQPLFPAYYIGGGGGDEGENDEPSTEPSTEPCIASSTHF